MAKRIKFTRSQMQRARRLLHMKYKPSEIAEEIGCSKQAIYKIYIPAGCPHERHENGLYYWIVGDQFRDWMLAQQREAVAEGRAKLAEGQGWLIVHRTNCGTGTPSMRSSERAPSPNSRR